MRNEGAAPASKGDIKELRTELKQEMATKGDLKEVRTELKQLGRTFAVELVKTNARIDRLDESFSAKLSQGVSKILKTTEDFMAQVQKVDRHQIITSWRVDELEKRVKTIEAR